MAEPTIEPRDHGRGRPAGRRPPASPARAAPGRLRHLVQRCSYGLTRKFSLFLIGLLTALTATLIAVSTLAEQRVTEERLRQRAEDSVRLLADAAAGTLATGHVEDLHRLLVRVAGRDEVLYVHVVDRQGGLIASGDPDGALSSWLIGDPLAAAGDAAASLSASVGRRLRDQRQ
jgi:hypothetical protein